MKYISIDIETTGLDPNKHNILEIAAVIDSGTNCPIEKLPTFQRYIGYPTLNISFDSFKFLGLDYYKKWMEASKEPLETVIYEFFDFVYSNSRIQILKGERKMPILPIAGKNFPSFDLQFLKKNVVFNTHHQNCFGYRYIDPAMFFLEEEDKTIPNTEELCRRAGVNYDGGKAHNALYDAHLIVKLIRNGFNLKRPTRSKI